MEDHQDGLNDIFAPNERDEEEVVFEEPEDNAPTPSSTNSEMVGRERSSGGCRHRVLETVKNLLDRR